METILSNRTDKQLNLSQKANIELKKLKEDFESNLIKNFKLLSQKGKFTLKYINNISTAHKAIVVIEVEEPIMILIGLRGGFNAIKKSIGESNYTSLKYLMLKMSFAEFSILPLIKGKSLNNQWNQIPLYIFHNKEFESLGAHNFMGKPIPIALISNLQLIDWSSLISKISEAKYMLEQFMRVPILNQHLLDLKELFNKELDELGESILSAHFQNKMKELQLSFQNVLDYLAELLNLFPYDEALYISDEFEQEYWNCIFTIRDNIFPTDKGDEENYEALINLDVLEKWSEKLQICFEQIGLLYFLICGKLIKENN